MGRLADMKITIPEREEPYARDLTSADGGVRLAVGPIDAPNQVRDLNGEIAAMVKLISEVGPRIPEIARKMGRHKETVRYWYKKLEEHDFAISAIINHEALGLKRIVMKVKLGDGYADYIKPLVQAMNELCYVVSYTKALPESIYVVTASVPEDFTAEYVDFIETLKQQGVFTFVEYYMLDWVRNKPMQTEYYDFERGFWDFDYQSLAQERPDAVPYAEPSVSQRVKFDKIDLLIAKELQRDASRELQEVQLAIKETDRVDINYKTLCWHLSEHVEPRLLKGYKVNWMGTKYDPVTDRVKQRQHSFLGVEVFAKSVRADERRELLSKIGRLPILWMEGAGSDFYAQVAIPTESTVEGLQYLQTSMRSVSDRASFLIADQRNALGFPFSYNLFEEENKAWKFNRDELLVKFRALEAQVR
jgi:DNA-binding Lrp family transcriptional regulator